MVYALFRDLAVVIWDIILGRAGDRDYVYINQDGTARELTSEERDYLSQTFDPTDGARPYIKIVYKARDGWGSISGFVLRRRVPKRVEVRAVNADYRSPSVDVLDYMNSDGFEGRREYVLERQRQREEAAKPKP